MSAPVRCRVAHVVSHPIQYFAPLYRELARRPEVELTVYFYSDATTRAFHDPGFGRTVAWDTPLLDGYRSEILASARNSPLPRGFNRRLHHDIIRAALQNDVVWAHGYSHLPVWLLAGGAALRRIPFLLREEANLLAPRPAWKRFLKDTPLRALFARAYGLFIGESNREYLRHYGIPEERLFRAPYAVNNEFFRTKAHELAPRKKALRARFGLDPEKSVVLFTGKLAPQKQPVMLADAVARVGTRRPVQLLIAGDGPLHEDLIGREGVVLAGFLNQSELPEAYAAADVLVLPSRYEPWGLVVNEALNFALPVVTTDRVGCAADLVRDGWNGRVVRHDDLEAMAAALEWVLDEERRRTLGERGRRIVADYGISNAADGIIEACRVSTARARSSIEERVFA